MAAAAAAAAAIVSAVVAADTSISVAAAAAAGRRFFFLWAFVACLSCFSASALCVVETRFLLGWKTYSRVLWDVRP